MTHDFRPQPDDDHPVRWSPIASGSDQWLSIDDALDRLTRDEPESRPDIETRLMRGDTLRTMFALYTFTPRTPGQS